MTHLTHAEMVGLQIILGLIVIGSIPAILFPILYFCRSPWRSHPVGRMMMMVSSSIGVVFALLLLFNFIPSLPAKVWLACGAYAYLAGALWYQFLTLLRIQRTDRHPVASEDRGRC